MEHMEKRGDMDRRGVREEKGKDGGFLLPPRSTDPGHGPNLEL